METSFKRDATILSRRKWFSADMIEADKVSKSCIAMRFCMKSSVIRAGTRIFAALPNIYCVRGIWQGPIYGGISEAV